MRVSATALTALLLAAATVSAFAQSEGAKAGKKPGNPMQSASPYLVSISVADLDESVKWYQENLGFVVTKRMDLPQYSLRIAFAELNGFRLELIEFKQSVSYETIQKQFPGVDDRAKVQGMGKLAFLVEDIEAVAERLRGRKVKFEREVTRDKESGDRWFIVTDNSGNWIQFFQKVRASRNRKARVAGGRMKT